MYLLLYNDEIKIKNKTKEKKCNEIGIYMVSRHYYIITDLSGIGIAL